MVITLGTRPTPDHNVLATTTPATDTWSACDLRHHTDPDHATASHRPVTIDPSGDPTTKFQTGSMIRPELMSYQRSESVRDNMPVGDTLSTPDHKSRTDRWPTLYVASRTGSRIQFMLRDAPRFSECGSHVGSASDLGGRPEFIIGSRP